MFIYWQSHVLCPWEDFKIQLWKADCGLSGSLAEVLQISHTTGLWEGQEQVKIAHKILLVGRDLEDHPAQLSTQYQRINTKLQFHTMLEWDGRQNFSYFSFPSLSSCLVHLQLLQKTT